MITCEDPSAVEGWLLHMQGVVALLKRWEPNDFNILPNAGACLHVIFLTVSPASTQSKDFPGSQPARRR